MLVEAIRDVSVSLSALLSDDPSSLQISLCTIPTVHLVFPTCRFIHPSDVGIGWDDYLQLMKIQGAWVVETSHDTSHYPATLFRLSGVLHKVVYLAEPYLGDATAASGDEVTIRFGADVNATAECLCLYQDVNNMSIWCVERSSLTLLV